MKAFFVVSVIAGLAFSAGTVQGAGTGYVYAYFKGGWPSGGHSGVFLSYSSDGLHFESMNGGSATFVPPDSWGSDYSTSDEDQTRDPSVVYGPDGLFHMVWTSGITTRSIGYASSADLKTWTNEQLIDIWSPSTVVNHTWAPEIFYDAANSQYQVIFASDLNNGDHKLYSLTTTDFTNFSAPSLFYYNGATVIDAMIAQDTVNNQYLMALKDEQNGQKNIRLATGPTAQGPWTTNNPIIVGPGSAIEPNATEGPSLLKIDDTWHLYYDAYGAGYLGVATTTNSDPTVASSWVNRTSESIMPVGPNAHHGTVFAAPLDAIAFDVLPFDACDLVDDDILNASDWLVFEANHLTDLSGYTPAEQAARGDLNDDGLNDHSDFLLFKRYYNTYYAAIGSPATFESMLDSLAVPEPGTGTGLALLVIGWGIAYRRRAGSSPHLLRR